MKKKKVLFIIYSASDTAGGGHFYSLKTISKSLKENIDYKILNLGYVYATPLVDGPHTHYINITKENFFGKIKEVIKYINEYNPDVIHAFDSHSLLFARTAAFFKKRLVVYTKCGGPNGQRLKYIPDADVHILFSKENFEDYSKYGNKNTAKYLIPNRAHKVKTDTIRANQLIEEYKLKDKFILLRISRFNSYYDLTFMQSLNLLKSFLKNNNNAVLIFIGKIQDEVYYEWLKNHCKGIPVLLITDDKYTNEASQLIDIASVVISTGRGVMEASSLDKTVFCPVNDNDMPVAINENTFEALFTYNFSERVKMDKEIIEKENSRVINDRLANHTLPFFEEYFSIENVKSKYLDIYNSSLKIRFRIINYLLHFALFLK